MLTVLLFYKSEKRSESVTLANNIPYYVDLRDASASKNHKLDDDRKISVKSSENLTR